MPDLLGQSIGRYHITEQLGQGGMATVYKAYDTRLESDVAVKVIRTDMFPPAALERVLKRFEREAKALARLTHPNIVSVLDYGEHDGAPYLIMKYLPGGTLKDRLGQPMPYPEAAHLLTPVARALAYAHGQGILHRDVKPSNILITQSGEPVLTDFGIAKLLESTESHTLTGTGLGVGTPEYMAPEQGLGKEIDGRADVYALGIVFYELVTGRKPYTAETPMAVLLKQFNDPLPRPRDYAPGLPESVEQCLFKALAKNPEDRYEDMRVFANALDSLAQNVPTSESIALESNQSGKHPAVSHAHQTVNPVDALETRNELKPRFSPSSIEENSRKNDIKLNRRKWAISGLLGLAVVVSFILGIIVPKVDSSQLKAPTNTATADYTVQAKSTLSEKTAKATIWASTTHLASTVAETSTPNLGSGSTQVQETNSVPVAKSTTSTASAAHTAQALINAKSTTPDISPRSDSSILFIEDFEDGKAQKISYISGDWQIVQDEQGNKVYDMDNSKNSAFPGVTFGSTNWKDYEIQFRMRILSPEAGWSIIEFRRDKEGLRKYVVSIDYDNISLNYTTHGYGWIGITNREYSLKKDVWYCIRVEARGTEINVFINDIPVINTDDTRFNAGIVQIQVGQYTHAQFDDIQVLSLNK